MNVTDFLKNVLNDLRVELADEFDRNFERKSFFGTPWAPTKANVTRGSLMLRTGDLRKSIRSEVTGTNALRFSSSLPYASIHNNGGTITVTANMKRYFWAMYYKAAGAVSKRQNGAARQTAGNIALSAQAQYYKNMALMKIGAKLIIPQRQFLGHHPQLDASIKQIIDDNVKELAESIKIQLQKIHK